MKVFYCIVISFYLFGCAGFDEYLQEPYEVYLDNVLYEVESDGQLEGELFFYDGSMKSKAIDSEFSYSCYTAYPSMIFFSSGDDVILRITYEDNVYEKSGNGEIVLVPRQGFE